MKTFADYKHLIPDMLVAKWQRTIDLMAKLFEVPTGFITRTYPESFEVLVLNQNDGGLYKVGQTFDLKLQSFCGEVIRTKELLYVNNSQTSEKWKSVFENQTYSYLGLPLVFPDGSLFGTICVIDSKEKNYDHKFIDFIYHFKEIIESDFLMLVNLFETLEQSEIDLQKEKERTRLYLDMAGVIMLVLDIEGKIKLINRKGAEVLGLPQDELVGRKWVDKFVSIERRAVFINTFQAIVKGERPVSEYLEEKILNVHGEEKTIAWHNVVVRDKNDRILGVLASGEDITEKRKTEQTLAEKDSLYKFVTDHSGDVIWLVDKDLKLNYISPSITKLRGFTPEEALNQNIESILTNDSLKIVLDLLNDVVHRMKQGEQNIFTELKEIEQPCKDGSTVWTESSVNAIFDNEGQFKSFVGVTRNITQRHKDRQALLESEAKFRSIIENAPNIIVIVGMDAKIKFINKNESQYPTESVINSDIYQYVPIEKRQFVKSMVDEVLLQQKQVSFEVETNHSVSPKWYNLQLGPIVENNEVTGFTAILTDFTEQKKAEIAIQESEMKYRLLFQNIPSAFMLCQLTTDEKGNPIDYTYVEFNDNAQVMATLNADYLIGKNARQVLSPENWHLIKEYGKVALEGGTFSTETYFYHIKKYLQVHAYSPAKGQFVLILSDITERKYSEIKLKESEDRYRKLIEILPDAVYVHIKGKIVFVNNACIKLLGAENAAQINGREIYDFVHPDFHSIAKERVDNEVDAETLAQPMEQKFVHLDGSEINVEVTVASLYYQNNLARLVVVHNITERKKAAELLLKLSTAVEQSANCIIIADQKGCIEYVNTKFLQVTGYSRIDVIGKNPRLLKSGFQDAEFYANLWKTILSGEVWTGEFHNKRKNGELFWENTTIAPIKDNQNQIINFIAIKEDITSRKKTERDLIEAKEKAQESDRLKSAFLANMSHEIRTPMNAIIGFTDLLAKPNTTEDKRKKFINIIKQRTNDLLNIINDILDLSKLESGQMKLHEFSENISTLFEDLNQFFQLKMEAEENKEVELRMNMNFTHNSGFFIADFTRMRQILINLISNALKFTESGYVEFGCSLMNIQDILFYVKDTGIGIPKEKYSMLFHRFRQGDETITRKYGGTGLGLSISKGLVDMMGGNIWFESSEGKGTTFYFTIPYNSSGNTFQLPEPEVIETKFNWKDKTILLVEDDDANADFFQEMLSETSVNLVIAVNGKLAMEYFLKLNKIDIILMDIRLPDADGLELTQQIKKINPNIPIIVQTAFAGAEDKAKSFSAGCNDFVTKPIEKNVFLSTVNKYLKTNK